MPGPIDPNEYAFQVEQTTKRLERNQRKARDAFMQTRQHTEALIRRDLKAWARENVDKAGRLRVGASLANADAIVQRHFDDFLKKVQGTSDWPPTKADFARGPGTVKGLAATSLKTIEAFRDELGLEGPDVAEFAKSKQARAVFEDHKLNPVGVREKESRQLREDVRRMTASRMTTGQIDETLNNWHMDENTFRLSTDSHGLAYGRAYLERIGRDMKATHFVASVSEPTARAIAAGGRTAGIAYRTMTRKQLEDRFRIVNKTRRSTTSFSTMGLGHGTHEVYFPLPPAITTDLVEHYAVVRRRFKAQKAGTLEPEQPFTKANARDAVRALRVDLLERGMAPAEVDSLLGRLEAFAGLTASTG